MLKQFFPRLTKYQVNKLVVDLLDIYGNRQASTEYKNKRLKKTYPNLIVWSIWGEDDSRYIKITFEYTNIETGNLYRVIYYFDSMSIWYEIYIIEHDTNKSRLEEYKIL